MAILKRADPRMQDLIKTYPGARFVKIRDLGSEADLRLNFVDETFVVYGPGSNEISFAVTFIGPTSKIAWGNCKGCIRPLSMCSCRGGFSVSRAVESIMDQKRAEAAGEEWGIHHPNYTGSLRKKRTEIASADYFNRAETKPKKTALLKRRTVAVQADTSPTKKPILRRIKKKEEPPKKLRRIRRG